MTVCGDVVLQADELHFKREFKGDEKKYEAGVSEDGSLIVVLDCTQDADVISQGVARELVNRVQKLRKKAGLQIGDAIEVYFEETGAEGEVEAATRKHRDLVVNTLRIPALPMSCKPSHAMIFASDSSTINLGGNKETTVTVHLSRPAVGVSHKAVAAKLNNNAAAASVVAKWLGTFDYKRVMSSPTMTAHLHPAVVGGGPLASELNDKTIVSVTLTAGEDYFPSTAAALQSESA